MTVASYIAPIAYLTGDFCKPLLQLLLVVLAGYRLDSLPIRLILALTVCCKPPPKVVLALV
jgi:hypothetical protein